MNSIVGANFLSDRQKLFRMTLPVYGASFVPTLYQIGPVERYLDEFQDGGHVHAGHASARVALFCSNLHGNLGKRKTTV